MFAEEEDEIHLQLGLDVGSLAPVGVFGLVVDHGLHCFGKLDQFVLGVGEVVFVGECVEDVIERLLFEIDPHLAEGFLLLL